MSVPTATFDRAWPGKFAQHQTMFISAANIAAGGMSGGWARDWGRLAIIPWPPLSCADSPAAMEQYLAAVGAIASHHVGAVLAVSPEDAAWAVGADPWGCGVEGVRLPRVETLLAARGLDDHDHPAVALGDTFELALGELCAELNIPLSIEYPADAPALTP